MKTPSNTMAINYNKLLDSPISVKRELYPDLSGRKSYYKKAIVYELTNGAKVLRSYDTIVAIYWKDKSGEEYYAINGKYSATTTVHQRDFLYQTAGVDIAPRKLVNYVQDFKENTAAITGV